jgi:hypothetical protein
MSDLRKAAQMALEAMDYMLRSGEWYCAQERADALRAALAQPVQVPVAWLRQRDSTLAVNDGGLFGGDWTPLYAHPPQRKHGIS